MRDAAVGRGERGPSVLDSPDGGYYFCQRPPVGSLSTRPPSGRARSTLAALRRARTSTDTLPPALGRELRTFVLQGMNPDGTRRLSTTALGATFVVPTVNVRY